MDFQEGVCKKRVVNRRLPCNSGNKRTRFFNKNISLANRLLIASLLSFSIAVFSAIIVSVGEKVSAYAETESLIANAAEAPASISLSITSSTGSSSSPDIAIQSPSDGGVTTGYHTLYVVSNSKNGYVVNMSIAQNGTDLKPSDSKNTDTIPSTTATLSNPAALPDNTWGVALPNNKLHANFDASNNATKFAAVPADGANIMSKNSATAADGDSQNVVFGVNLQDGKYKAGTYSTVVTHMATVSLPLSPTVTDIQPSAHAIGDNNSTISITGTNLDTVSELFIDLNKNGTMDNGEECTNLNVSSNTKLTCDVPKITDSTMEGSYSVIVNAQSVPSVKVDNGFTYYNRSTVRTNGDPSSNCKVDIDANMIPIKYAGDTTNPKWVKADISKEGDWYDYENKKWANAVTVKSSKVNTYKNAAAGTEIPENDILGYWVYIPRYKYKVLRYSPTDASVNEQNFTIIFQTTDDAKGIPTQNNEWATHPAFTFGNKELNGLWAAKFEITGTQTNPTVKPSVSSLRYMTIGNLYDTAIRMGVQDATGSQYGNKTTTTVQNYHNLATSKSHMMRNSEWGAATYLSTSSFGAGVNKVQKNGYNGYNTGCGPQADGDTYSGYTCNKYNTTIGQLASTTNNTYGIYDMSGGAYEYVMGGYSADGNASVANSYISNAVKPPYVDLYQTASMDSCTFTSCGGHALFETEGWGSDFSYFVNTSNPWLVRGGNAYDGMGSAGVIAANNDSGRDRKSTGSRAVLQ